MVNNNIFFILILKNSSKFKKKSLHEMQIRLRL